VLGGGAGDDGDALAREVGEAGDVGGSANEQAAAVHENHLAEIHLFLPGKRVRGGAALEVDRAVRDHGHAVLRGHRRPLELQIV
jgi:hypothetical protein